MPQSTNLRPRAGEVDLCELADKAITGNRRALARAATVIEGGGADGEKIISRLFAQAGRARILGITGPAGAGKSTLVNACVRYLRRRGHPVAVIAVDPTSTISQGALLGDRIRMMEHSGDPDVFIRSLATRGQTGGLAASALGIGILLDAAGFEFIFVETIGVGQDEVDVVSLAQVTAVVLMPGAGDDVQAVKAGIMEVADIFVINKAELPGAAQLHEELRFVQSLAATPARTPIFRVSAISGEGIDELMEVLAGLVQERAETCSAERRWGVVLRRLAAERAASRLSPASLSREANAVTRKLTDPYSAVGRLLTEISAGSTDER